jgi:hypothetical protein
VFKKKSLNATFFFVTEMFCWFGHLLPALLPLVMRPFCSVSVQKLKNIQVQRLKKALLSHLCQKNKGDDAMEKVKKTKKRQTVCHQFHSSLTQDELIYLQCKIIMIIIFKKKKTKQAQCYDVYFFLILALHIFTNVHVNPPKIMLFLWVDERICFISMV